MTATKTIRKAPAKTAAKAASKPSPARKTKEQKLLDGLNDVQANIVGLMATLDELRAERAKLLLQARAAEVPYTKLGAALDLPTGAVHGMVKAAAGK